MSQETEQACVKDAIEHLITTFGELNSSSIEELDCEPSPLDFMRYVARNTPFVVRGGASSWRAFNKWDKDYLLSALAGQSVNVAVTPHGNADAPTVSPAHESPLFAKPHEELQPFEGFLDYIISQETDPDFPQSAEVRYAQTRESRGAFQNCQCLSQTNTIANQENDNLRQEYQCLFKDAQKDIPFASVALQKPPEAINMWIGNSRSVTATHKDSYENIYVQIRGRKHFVLLSPLHHHCMNEKPLQPATYARASHGQLSLSLDQDADPVPVVTWDPDHPDRNCASLSPLAQPVRVTLEPGDMLYLPAMWSVRICVTGFQPES
ncbi:Transcription factor jumonji/aspartyl beta-hydroxylase [Beauveria brongniartii RCEF 3172]|uniref:Transcription factor jumonji/aspartyl beta-hydroxylase n=1 Tax=Beauveria brongniartii RCEF 3172 TaxID=1081107 RepID=A0A167FGX2_9HYPO|nr:Transcription factor jumonji/aspartyl beta-hydroxylase [Beauveria brongniartii RCEF 3172]